MKNCLLTQLKSKVDKDLPVFNQLILHVTKNDDYTEEDDILKSIRALTFINSAPVTVKVVGDVGYFCLSRTDYTTQIREYTYAAGEHNICVPNLTFDLTLDGLYNITSVLTNIHDVVTVDNLISYDANLLAYNDITGMFLTKSTSKFDISNISKMDSLVNFTCKNCVNVKGNIGSLIGKSFDILVLQGSGVNGTIEQLMQVQGFSTNTINISATNFPNISGNINALASRPTLVTFVATNNRNITGSIESLVGLTSITTLSLAGCNPNSFTGELENFVEGQIANGRLSVTSSAPIVCPWLCTYAKFGGSYRTDTGQGLLTWQYVDNTRTKIAWYCGGTTGGIQNTTKVYVKGYTDNEISNEPTFVGKTVIKV